MQRVKYHLSWIRGAQLCFPGISHLRVSRRLHCFIVDLSWASSCSATVGMPCQDHGQQDCCRHGWLQIHSATGGSLVSMSGLMQQYAGFGVAGRTVLSEIHLLELITKFWLMTGKSHQLEGAALLWSVMLPGYSTDVDLSLSNCHFHKPALWEVYSHSWLDSKYITALLEYCSETATCTKSRKYLCFCAGIVRFALKSFVEGIRLSVLSKSTLQNVQLGAYTLRQILPRWGFSECQMWSI